MEAIPLDTAVRVADLAAKDSVVAIAAANNPDYDYYLMKVTSDGVVELDEPTTDDYGCTFPRGFLGLEGYSFVRDNIIDMTYKLDKSKTAFVLAGTVRHICGELQKCRNNIYKVPLTVNEEIIASLWYCLLFPVICYILAIIAMLTKSFSDMPCPQRILGNKICFKWEINNENLPNMFFSWQLL